VIYEGRFMRPYSGLVFVVVVGVIVTPVAAPGDAQVPLGGRRRETVISWARPPCSCSPFP
jgi:hypothetical protein